MFNRVKIEDMKIRYYIQTLIAVAALMNTSCANENEYTENTSNKPIEFSVNKNIAPISRASIKTTWGDADQFNIISMVKTDDVWSILINKESVSKNSDGNWITAKQHYWPNQKQQLDFYGYYPSATLENLITSVIPTQATTFNYTVSNEESNQVDILGAHVTYGNSQFATTIPLEFQHLQTAIYVKMADGSKVGTIKSISITNANSVGTFDYATMGWSNQNTPLTYSRTLNYASSGTDGGTYLVPATNPLLLLPQTLSDDSRINIVFTDTEGDHTMSYAPTALQKTLVGGYALELSISVTSLYTIELTSKVINWLDGGLTNGELKSK